jgi:formylglycine-generating enzyme required for sulfatase activity
VAWYYDNSGNTPHPVGTKSPNELGIYDMSGNVWELCSDWYGASTGSYRVLRGGSWYYDARFARVSNRSYYYRTPDYRVNIMGFRLASGSK